jgi:hypothetical protein
MDPLTPVFTHRVNKVLLPGAGVPPPQKTSSYCWRCDGFRMTGFGAGTGVDRISADGVMGRAVLRNASTAWQVYPRKGKS